jgi:hypothetical protein
MDRPAARRADVIQAGGRYFRRWLRGVPIWVRRLKRARLFSPASPEVLKELARLHRKGIKGAQVEVTITIDGG